MRGLHLVVANSNHILSIRRKANKSSVNTDDYHINHIINEHDKMWICRSVMSVFVSVQL